MTAPPRITVLRLVIDCQGGFLPLQLRSSGYSENYGAYSNESGPERTLAEPERGTLGR